MSIEIRKAKTDDALAIDAIATSRWKTTRLQEGITERQLEREGFLLYPLAADHYRERIARSDHFWVAENGDQIVAYSMAYTFAEMRSFTYLTENDQTLLSYFSSCGYEPGCVYLAQVARVHAQEARGSISSLAIALFKHATDTGAPAVLCEISMKPRNNISMRSAARSGFRLVATRTKTDPTTGKDRTSGTFMRALGSMTRS